MMPSRPRLANAAAVFLLFACGCAGPGPDGTRWIAHRGHSSEAPENTISAVRLALELDPAPDYVEIDVRATSDGQLVIIHDDTLDRTTDASGPVDAVPFAALARVDAGFADRFGDAYRGEPLPRLADVLDAAATKPGTGIMIEIKAHGLGGRVAALVRDRGELAEHVIASFKPDVIAEAKYVVGDARTLFLVSEPEPYHVELARLLGAEILGIHNERATPELVELVHAAGMELWAYTVNEPARAADLTALGVDGIISDRVDAVSATERHDP